MTTDDEPTLVEKHGRGLAAAARTHTGKVRSVNQDAFVCLPDKGVFAVIDGMGGTRAGEVAAEIARKEIVQGAASGTGLEVSLDHANTKIYEQAAANPDEKGMGCVATAVRVEGPELAVSHVGDTRALLASSAGCEQLTRDHTVVADIEEQQGLTENMTSRLPGQHQVTRDIGGSRRADPSWIDTGRAPFETGDVLLLCSDGLSDHVGDKELFRLLARARKERQDVKDLVNHLVELTLERGARDNVTVVAVRREATVPGKDTIEVEVPLARKPGRAKRSPWTLVVILGLVVLSFILGWLARPFLPAPSWLPVPSPPEVSGPPAEDGGGQTEE